MRNQTLNQNPDTSTHLKDVFEQSLAMLGETKRDLGRDKPSPRVRGSAVPLYIDAASLQKRALDDAAKALATLWKVPAPGQARWQSRLLTYNR